MSTKKKLSEEEVSELTAVELPPENDTPELDIPSPIRNKQVRRQKRAFSAPTGTPLTGTVIPIPPEDLAKYPKVNYVPGPGEADHLIDPDENGRMHVILPNGTKMSFFAYREVEVEESS